MTRSATGVLLRPQLCDRCGKCLRACPLGLISLSAGYVCVDVSECDGCLSCCEVCGTGALVGDSRPRLAVPVTKGPTPVPPPPRASAPAINEQRRAVGDARWTAVDAVAVAAVLLAAMFAKDAAVGSRAFALIPGRFKTLGYVLVLSAFYAVQLATLAFLARRHGSSLFAQFKSHAEGGKVRAWAGSVGMVVALLFAARIASTAWGAVLDAIGWKAPGDSGVLSQLLGAGPAGVGMVLLMAVVVGPVVEEMVFRGVIAKAMEARLGTVTAVVGSAALFALYHVTPWLYVQMFVLGCALAWLALTRRTLWPAVALHALYNAVSALAWLLR